MRAALRPGHEVQRGDIDALARIKSSTKQIMILSLPCMDKVTEDHP
jgi:hypothetical protein